jgi:hypothetical protein
VPAFSDWFPPALVGITFTGFAVLKLYGMSHGMVGGGGKPFRQRCLGSCPTWSRQTNVGLIVLFLIIGLANLAWALSSFM